MKIIFSLFCFFIFYSTLQAQNFNSITTAVPFLLVNENAQTGGIGGINVVASPFYYHAAFRNPALLARNERMIGGSLTHIPYLRRLVNDINIFSGNFFYSLNSNNTIGFSGIYSNLGDIEAWGGLSRFRPHEFSSSIQYAHAFSEKVSAGAGVKFIYSNLTMGHMVQGTATKPVRTGASDLGLNYRDNVKLAGNNVRTDVGFSLTNMGPKIAYSNSFKKEFLPASAQLGLIAELKKEVSEKTNIYFNIAYQAEKLLVPTPSAFGVVPNVSALEGMLQSFTDAPDGAREEWHEINHKTGLEIHAVKEKYFVAVRGGYCYEHPTKGNRQYITTGLGLGVYGFTLDLAYLLAAQPNNPLANTLYFTLGMKLNRDKSKRYGFN